MTKRIFDPVVSTYLTTDGKNHSESIKFKLSYGFELENYENPVFKIQMYDGEKVKGRQAPSYSDSDFDKIVSLKLKLKETFDSMDHRLRDIVVTFPID